MPEGLNLVIDANVQGAVTGLQQVEAQMKKATTSGQVFSAQVVKTGQAISKIPQSSNQATQSLVNLSRVAQDAPYGFIGIANNINPLLESFQRLKASTGTTGGALKALKESLTGAAGIGLAVGVVSSLLLVFGDRLTTVGGGASQFSKIMGEVKNSFVEAYTSVADLVSNISLAKQGFISKEGVVKQYNETIGKTTGLIKNIDEAEQGLIKNGAAYVTMMMQKAIANIAFQKAAEKAFEQQVILASFEKDRAKITGFVEDVLEKKINKRIKSLEKEKDSLQDVAIEAKKYAGEIAGIFKFDLFGDNKQGKSKISKDKKLNWKDFINWEDSPDIPKEQLYKDISDAGERSAAIFKDAFENRLTTEEHIDFGLISKLSEKTFEFKGFKGLTEAQLQAANTAETIANTLTPSLDAMVQAIGRGENAFQAFGEGVKAILAQVITKLISTAILAAALSAIPGFGGVAGGGGFMDIFGKLLGFGGGKAAGGPVGSGTAYVVGEKGPEIFVPNVSGSIIPNNSVGGFSSGSGSSGGRRRDIIRGQNIILAYARTNRSNSRLG